MALRQLILAKELRDKNKLLEELREEQEALESNEDDLAKAIDEAETDEEKDTVEEAVEKHEKDLEEVKGKIIDLESEVEGIEAEIEEIKGNEPTWTSGEGNKVNNIPGNYIDSPLINNYPVPKVQEYRVELTEKEQELSESEIISIVRDKAEKQFSENKIDEPRISVNIDFVELSRTEEYKDLKFLQTINLHDYVTVRVPKLNIDITSQVVYYKYDCLQERYIDMTIGNTKRNLSSNSFTIHELNNKIDEATDFLTGAMEYAQNVITGNQGGHVVIRSGGDGKPYEILIMDNEDINLAKNVIRMNKEGIGFSSNGYNGPFSTAITIGGGIVADFITTGVLSANLIKAGILQDNKGNVVIDFDKGTFRMKSSKNGVNFTLDENGYNQYNASGKQTFGVDSRGNVKISGGVKTFFDNGNTAIEMDGSIIEFYLKNTNRSQGYIAANSWSGYPNVGAITLTHGSNSSLGIFYESGSSTYPYMIFDRHLQSPQDSGTFGEKPIRLLLGTRFESEAVFDTGIRTREIDCRGSIKSSGSIFCPTLKTTEGMITSYGSIHSGGDVVASEDVRTGDGWIEKGVRYSLKQIWDRI